MDPNELFEEVFLAGQTPSPDGDLQNIQNFFQTHKAGHDHSGFGLQYVAHDGGGVQRSVAAVFQARRVRLLDRTDSEILDLVDKVVDCFDNTARTAPAKRQFFPNSKARWGNEN